MKWIYRLSSVFILAAALSLPFYADYKSDGRFLNLESIPDKLMSMFKPSSASLNAQSGQHAQSGDTTTVSDAPQADHYFRWQDEHGQWHFSDQAPKQSSEQVTIDTSKLQTISGMDADVIDNALGKKDKAAATDPSKTATDFTGTEPTFDNLTKVMENAQQAADMMNERNRALQHIVGEDASR